MAFDFEKEAICMPKNKPEIVDAPRAHSITVRGKGDPNENGEPAFGIPSERDKEEQRI